MTILPFIAFLKADTMTLQVTESVWVYSHASDPAHDETLRVWGIEGMATPEGKGDGEDWGYGYLRWDVSKLPPGQPKSAVLVLYNINPPAFHTTPDKNTFLQARALVGTFSGSTWEYSQSVKVHPDLAKTVFGAAAPKPWGDSKEPIEIDIDLLAGPGEFARYLTAAEGRDDHALCLALTSAIDANTADAAGASTIGLYKVYSAAAKADLRPKLKLTY